MSRSFWWLWHRSLNRICKQKAKTRPSCFGETMLEKSGRFAHPWAVWASAEIFPGVAISTFCLSFSGCWQMDVHIKFYPFYTAKISPWKHALHSHPFKSHIQVKVYTSLLKGYTFCHPLQLLLNWRIIQYRYHCKLQTTESELTWNIHNYVCSAVISRDAGAAVGRGIQ